ncbi:hypothetical protein [Leuconostoc citreum]
MLLKDTDFFRYFELCQKSGSSFHEIYELQETNIKKTDDLEKIASKIVNDMFEKELIGLLSQIKGPNPVEFDTSTGIRDLINVYQLNGLKDVSHINLNKQHTFLMQKLQESEKLSEKIIFDLRSRQGKVKDSL